jgi:hypothetical protein
MVGCKQWAIVSCCPGCPNFWLIQIAQITRIFPDGPGGSNYSRKWTLGVFRPQQCLQKEVGSFRDPDKVNGAKAQIGRGFN